MREVGLKFLAFSFLFLALVSSPAFAAKKSKKNKAAESNQASVRPPDWTFAKPADYPESRYMTASGSSQFQKSADSDALSNLAAIFSQKVSSNALAKRNLRQDSEESALKEFAYEQSVGTRVDESELIGVEIKERFFDGKKYYSLAVMDKVEAVKLYKGAIEAGNDEIQRLESFSQDDKISIDRFANLFLAQKIAEENLRRLDRLFVINADEARSVEAKSPQDLRSKRVSLARQIPIFVQVSGDQDSMAYSSIVEALNSFGFRVSQNSGERYSLFADFSIEQKLSADKESWQTFYSLSCSLDDKKNSAAIWSESVKGRISSFKKEDSLDRAKAAMGTKVKDYICQSFSAFLLGSKK